MTTYTLPDNRFEMPALFTPGRKPVGNVKADLALPYQIFPTSNNFVDITSGVRGTVNGTVSTTADAQHGEGIVFNGSSYIDMPTPLAADAAETLGFSDNTGHATIVLVMSWTRPATTQGWVYCRGRTSENNTIAGIYVNTDGTVGFLSRTSNVSLYHYGPSLSSNNVYDDGRPHTVVVRYSRLSGGTLRMYIDGNFEAAAVVGDTSAISYQTETIGALRRAAVSNYFVGTVYYAGQIFLDDAPDAFAQELSRNPYQFLMPA